MGIEAFIHTACGSDWEEQTQSGAIILSISWNHPILADNAAHLMLPR